MNTKAMYLAAIDEVITGRRKQTKLAKKPRTDSLSSLILEIVTKNPKITTTEVLQALREYERGDVIYEIDENYIWLVGNDKPVPTSGLKDRVSRAKRNINSR